MIGYVEALREVQATKSLSDEGQQSQECTLKAQLNPKEQHNNRMIKFKLFISEP